MPLDGHPNALRLVATRLSAALTPPDEIPFARWISENIVLIDGPRAGSLWRADGAPYLPAIAECLSDENECNLVTVRKCQQSGASILGLAWTIYIAEREPANTLYAAPGNDALREMNSRKLQPLIDAYEKRTGLQTFSPITSRSGTGSTTYEKKFPGGYLALANANAAMDLSAQTIKKGVKDEVSKWQDIPGVGDPENLFFGRFTAFRRTKDWKILEISTPEHDTGEADGMGEGHCRIDRSFRASDQRFWHVDCPGCGDPFVQELKHFQVDYETPARSCMVCPECGHPMSEAERVVAVRGGRYIATAEGDGRHPGFHIDAFMSLMMSFEDIAEDYIKAEKGGERAKKDFANLVLGLTYAMRGDAPDHVRLLERRESYTEGQVPAEGLLLVAGCDVQHTGIWCEIVAFASDRQSWTVTRRFFEGATDVPGHGAWLDMEALHRETFPDAWGRPRKLDAIAVDAGDGGRANQVYGFARSRTDVYAIKGVSGWASPAIGTAIKVDVNLNGQKLKGGAVLWPVGTWSLKAEFYTELNKLGRVSGEAVDPAGYCHFGDFLDEGYFKQITAEYLTVKMVAGKRLQQWAESGPNHLLDCRIYAKAMAEYLGLSRMTESDWAKMRQLRGAPPEALQPDLLAPVAHHVTAKPEPKPAAAKQALRRGRGVRSRGIG